MTDPGEYGEHTDEQSEDTADRDGWLKALPYAVFALYVIAPALLVPVAGTPWLLVGFIFTVAAIAGLVDGYCFRPSWTLPLSAAGGFWVAKILYFNDGTFIYALGVAVVSALCAWLMSLVRKQPAPMSSTSSAQV